MRKKLNDATCGYCNSTDIFVERREKVLARPKVTFSLAGVQMEYSPVKVPNYWLVCDGCGFESDGRINGRCTW